MKSHNNTIFINWQLCCYLIQPFFSMPQQPLVGQGILINDVSWSHSFRHTTLGRLPLDEWSARHRDLFLTTHNTHQTQTSRPLVGFKPTIPANEQPQTHTLDCTATGISTLSSTDHSKNMATFLIGSVFHPGKNPAGTDGNVHFTFT
jgi:hypothetical protein